jgi:hypothetical protein
MQMWKYSVFVLAFLAVVAAAAAFVLREGLLAALDNVIGIRLKTDIRLVKEHPVGKSTISAVIGPGAIWRASHRDELWRTFVEARIPGTIEKVYHWEVDRGFSPQTSYSSEEGVFITPLTRATAELVPGSLPEKVRCRLPDEPGMSAAAIYQSAGIAPAPDLSKFLTSTRE